MSGKREQICARLLALGEGLAEWKTFARNIPDVSPESTPAYVLWDGDLDPNDDVAAELNLNGRARRLGPQIMEMTPSIVVAVTGPPETVGTTANELMELVAGTVIHDATLTGLILHNRLKWNGAGYSILSADGLVMIQYQVRVVLTYAIHAADLLPEPETA